MILAYLTDEATWVRHQGTDQWGEPNASVEEVVPTRIDRKLKMVRDTSGSEAVSTAKLYLIDRPSNQDRFKFDGREHPVLEVHTKGAFSVSHYEVFVA